MLRYVGLVSLLLLLSLSCVFAGTRLTVYTVNYPLAYFAERIGDDQVEVVFPAPPDVDPAYWMPDQATILAYQQADLVLLNGANYAKWVGKVSLPRGKMVDTSRKFKDRYIYATEVTTHSHGAEGAHAHESLAFTTWLDLRLAKLQAAEVYKAMTRKRPMSEMRFKENFKALADELDELNESIKTIVAKAPGRPLLGSHPVYDYLSAGYGMNLKSVHWEPDEAPSFSQMNELKQVLEEHQAAYMLWEEVPIPVSVDQLKAKGVASVTFNPCGNRPENGDFMTVMKKNIDSLKIAYR
jgi:zinc transport system substrate-binding protein